MSKGLEELKKIALKWQYGVFTFIPNFEIIEKELKDNENKLALICEILVDVSKGNYSDLKVAIEEIREVLG